MKTEIFVMTHKECLVPDVPGYIRLQVGSELHDDLGYMRDNEGDDHISDLNMYLPDADPFGELRKIETELILKMRKEI